MRRRVAANYGGLYLTLYALQVKNCSGQRQGAGRVRFTGNRAQLHRTQTGGKTWPEWTADSKTNEE